MNSSFNCTFGFWQLYILLYCFQGPFILTWGKLSHRSHVFQRFPSLLTIISDATKKYLTRIARKRKYWRYLDKSTGTRKGWQRKEGDGGLSTQAAKKLKSLVRFLVRDITTISWQMGHIWLQAWKHDHQFYSPEQQQQACPLWLWG